MFGGIKNRRQTNLEILSQTLKLVRNEEELPRPATTPNQPTENPKESSRSTQSGAKREVGIEGNGIIEKKMQKKKPEYINFKALLTG